MSAAAGIFLKQFMSFLLRCLTQPTNANAKATWSVATPMLKVCTLDHPAPPVPKASPAPAAAEIGGFGLLWRAFLSWLRARGNP
jgi:hypothetical protein